MTHDELLAEIDENAHLPKWGNCSCGEKTEGFEHHLSDIAVKKDKALRAVVELHHPLYYRKGEIETKGAHCAECSEGSHGETAVDYPCPTIQAIEKELK